VENGISDVEIGNLGALSMLERWGVQNQIHSIRSDFTLYTLNTSAAAHWGERGVGTLALSVEDDFKNIHESCRTWPEKVNPQVILFKDTPLFIAESCSLTALHNGCPTNAVCGYRTLEIQNDSGEQFFVAHETCKSIVYDKRSFSITHKRTQLEGIGLRHFRADFLTRNYDENRFKDVLRCVFESTAVSDTHVANFDRTLL
jgi:putative protease